MLALVGGSQIVEFLIAARKWRAFYASSLKRSIRFFSDRYSHLDFRGHVDIPESFIFDESRAKPRGVPVNAKYYSEGYDIAFEELLFKIRNQVLAFRSILE